MLGKLKAVNFQRYFNLTPNVDIINLLDPLPKNDRLTYTIGPKPLWKGY